MIPTENNPTPTVKSENEMSDEELEAHEKLTAVKEDVWDRLELLRKKLNESHLEKMYVIKRAQALGPACPYYRKALRLFQESQEAEIRNQVQSLARELELI